MTGGVRALVVGALLATTGLAADFSIDGSIGAGYANWRGWGGYSISLAGGPLVTFGQFGLGANALLGQAKVTKNGQSLSFWSFGGLGKVRYSVVQLGAGYGYIPGFTDEVGDYHPGPASPLLTIGVVFPIRLTDRLTLNAGAENVFVTGLSDFYNPSVKLAVTCQLDQPDDFVPIQKVLSEPQPEDAQQGPAAKSLPIQRPASEPEPKPTAQVVTTPEPEPVPQPAPKEEFEPTAPIVVTAKTEQQPKPVTGEKMKPEESARSSASGEATHSFVDQASGGGRGLFRTQSPVTGVAGVVAGVHAIGRNPRGAWAADGVIDFALTPYSSRVFGAELYASGGGLSELADAPGSSGSRYTQGFEDFRAGAKVSLLAVPLLKIGVSAAYVIHGREGRPWRDPLAVPGPGQDRFLWLTSGALQFEELGAHGPNLLFNFGQCGGSKIYGAGAEFAWTALSVFVEARSLQSMGGMFWNTDSSGDVRATIGAAVKATKAVIVKSGYTWGIGKASAPNELVLGFSVLASFRKPVPKGGVIVGRVADFRTLKPLRASVTFLGTRLPPINTDTTTGAFRVASAPPGRTVVDAGADGYYPQTLTHDVVNRETTAYEFMLRPRGVYGAIAGMATDVNTDRPLRATIECSAAGVGATNSDSATGAFRFDDVPAGEYSVSATSPGYFRTSRTVKVEADKVAAPALVLTPRSMSAKLTGKITDRRTGAAVTALVRFTNAAFESVNSDSATGVYTAEAPAGSYLVAVETPSYIGQTATVVLAVERPAIRDFELVNEGMAITLRGISFNAGTATIRPESKAALNDAAKILIDNPTIRAEIQGHTDNRGSDESNMRLSEKRATAVVSYLVENCGIDVARLAPKGYGATVPIAGNDTKEGRAANQRIELVVRGAAKQE